MWRLGVQDGVREVDPHEDRGEVVEVAQIGEQEHQDALPRLE